MIKRLAGYLGWNDEKLNHFLGEKFHRRALWALTPHQAWAATRLLLEYTARRDIKLRKGRDYRVSKAEINREIAQLKARLRG